MTTKEKQYQEMLCLHYWLGLTSLYLGMAHRQHAWFFGQISKLYEFKICNVILTEMLCLYCGFLARQWRLVSFSPFFSFKLCNVILTEINSFFAHKRL
jgi:hypothetical protein